MTIDPAPEWPTAQAWPAPPGWPAPSRRTTRTRRVAAGLAGALLLLPGLGLLAGGGTLLWAHSLDRSDGFVVSPRDGFTSAGHALVSDRIDLAAAPDWLPLPDSLGTARLEVTGTGAGEVFVGVAAATDVAEYLDGVQRTVVDGLGFDGPASRSDALPGGAPAALPGDQDFWIAAAAGAGTQEVTWEPADGEWAFVVMNADGSAGVDVEARIGAEAPALGGVGWAALVVGSVLTVPAARLLVRASRRPEDPTVQYRQPQWYWSTPRAPVS
ncbi:hypothetical protein [Geodermatophilus sp. CPCC 205506]|uniref:hypothetical protein n=1 Tax=Geodermatophilus sp. CPCC 205506 TaxID=2936596 RepID=UPI003EED8839